MAKNVRDQALEILETHSDPNVRAAAETIRKSDMNKIKVLGLVQETLQQLRLDVKYMAYDLECTRRERDEAIAKLK